MKRLSMLESHRLKELGSKIRAERKKQKMSAQTLSDIAETTKSNIINIELGKQNTTILNLYRIADALDLVVDIGLLDPHAKKQTK